MKLNTRYLATVAGVLATAEATCNADNCLRALRATQTPGRLEAAQSFCATFTATPVTATASIPTFAIQNCVGNVASRVSSACSCLPTPTGLPDVTSQALQDDVTSEGCVKSTFQFHAYKLMRFQFNGQSR